LIERGAQLKAACTFSERLVVGRWISGWKLGKTALSFSPAFARDRVAKSTGRPQAAPRQASNFRFHFKARSEGLTVPDGLYV